MWSSSFLPNELSTKERTQKTYLEKNGKALLVDYLEKELKKQERIVLETAHWVWLVPYWATWPYETMLLPRRHVQRIEDLTDEERDGETMMIVCCKTLYKALHRCMQQQSTRGHCRFYGQGVAQQFVSLLFWQEACHQCGCA